MPEFVGLIGEIRLFERSLSLNVLIVLSMVFAALVVGTSIRLALLRWHPRVEGKLLISSVRTWWILAVLLAAAVLLGPYGIVGLIGIVNLLAFREYLLIAPLRPFDKRLLAVAWIAATAHYAVLAMGWWTAFVWLIPATAAGLIVLEFALRGWRRPLVVAAGYLVVGLLIVVYGPSHAARLAMTPDAANPAAGAEGWFLYLVLLTELNDIAQALWGRALGRRKVTPKISPNKSWEGLILGVLTTIAIALALAPLLTPFGAAPPGFDEAPLLGAPYFWAAASGLLIGIFGFFGDISMSAIKRRTGTKDFGDLLPGQGGALDRIDSLTFTAPVFFYLVAFLSL